MLKFTKDHEWVRVEGDVATIGITTHAQEQLGDVVFVELPEPGKAFDQGAPAAVVESVKAASDVYAPVAGTVVEVNQAIVDEPGMINADLSPSRTLGQMHQVVQPYMAQGQIAGVCLAYLDGAQVTLANAGAIAPLLRDGMGARMLDLGGLPLGTPLSGRAPYKGEFGPGGACANADEQASVKASHRLHR